MIVNNFLESIQGLIPEDINNLIDCGCGEGMVLNRLRPVLNDVDCYAFDFSKKELEMAKKNIGEFCSIKQGDIYKIKHKDNSFDLVLCTEVMEHLEYPLVALKEIHRITKKYALLSVPREPLWRVLNFVRGKYIRELGNTPGHLNHWSSLGFKKFISKYFKVLKTKHPTPWTVLLCEKK